MQNVLVLILAILVVLPLNAQQSVTITATKDNTLYETTDGSQSNGAGAFLFVGQVGSGGGSKNRRTVVKFDLSGKIPANAVITGAKLKMNMSRSIAGVSVVKVHRLSLDWGEGTSDASANEGSGALPSTNDATWIHRFFSNQQWITAGGDFVAQPSASVSVGGAGSYTWQDTLLRADVVAWNLLPSINFGWILIGDESAQSAKRFDSRETGAPANRPQLTVEYTISSSVAGTDPVPHTFGLEQNYPNPFNPSTMISFSIPNSAPTSLKVFDILGNEVVTVVEQPMDAGIHSVTFDAKTLASGIYFYRLQSGGYSSVKKLMVLK